MTGGHTFGELRLDSVGGVKVWVLDVEPDAAIDAKRNLRQAKQTAAGPICVDATDDAARTIDWLMMRWPLQMTAQDRRQLRKQVRAHKAREQRILDLLATSTSSQVAAVDEGPLLALGDDIELRGYQQLARDLIFTSGRLLLADELGLGKTIECLATLADSRRRPALAVTLTNLPPQWAREARKVFPDLRIHIAKKGSPYDLRDDSGNEPDLIIMNYAKLAGWQHHLAGKVRTVFFDEVQELRRPGTDKYTAAQHISAKAGTVVGASATPIMNYSGGECFAIMDAIAPGCLGSDVEFGREWCSNATYGVGRHSTINDHAALRSRLIRRGLWLRRTRQEVGIELPPIRAVEQYVPADPNIVRDTENAVAEVARIILSDTASRQDRWVAAGDLEWQMRQATGIAKAPFVAAFVELLMESEERVVVFAWHRQVHEILMAALAKFNPMLYTGTESVTQKERAVTAFTSGNSRILIMSLRSGAGLDGLQAVANVCVFAELDWSAGIHKQCIGRLGRPGQTQSTLAYFAVTDSGSDPIVLDVNNVKALDAELLVNPSEDAPDDAPEVGADRIAALARTVLSSGRAPVQKAS